MNLKTHGFRLVLRIPRDAVVESGILDSVSQARCYLVLFLPLTCGVCGVVARGASHGIFQTTPRCFHKWKHRESTDRMIPLECARTSRRCEREVCGSARLCFHVRNDEARVFP